MLTSIIIYIIVAMFVVFLFNAFVWAVIFVVSLLINLWRIIMGAIHG